MPLRNRSFKPLAIAALIPLVFAAELLLPERAGLGIGVREARGCSGAANPDLVAGWSRLRPALLNDEPGAEAAPLPVATDGFFVMDAEAVELSVEAAQTSLQVVVTDAAGETVAGETTLLSSRKDGRYFFGWSASAALEVGAKLQAKLSASPIRPNAASYVGGQFDLEVVGEPTTAPSPTLTFASWFDFYRGQAGATVSCAGATSSCLTTLLVPLDYVEQIAARLSWQVPAVRGGVAWTVRLEAGSTETDAALLDDEPRSYFGEAPAGSYLELGRVAFPTPAPEHCVGVVLTDLRTSEEHRVEACDAPAPATSADSDTGLGSCYAPPTDALTKTWCRLKGDAFPRECANIDSAVGGSAGAGGSGGAGTTAGASGVGSGGIGGSAPSEASGSGGDERHPLGAIPESDQPGSPRTSQGCQLGPSSSPTAGVAGLALGLALFGRRRRSACHPDARLRA